MINFFDMNFKRAIVHTIIPKDAGTESALSVESNEIINLDETVTYTITERLAKGIEKKTKTFDLSIEAFHSTSFFQFATNLIDSDDISFIDNSKRIANLLANAQTSARHSGGYLIVVEATKGNSEKKVILVIKAELQEALLFYENDIKLIQNVFLSPAQKMFKFGLIYQREPHEIEELPHFLSEPNIEWGCMIYDEQFRAESKPAEYFYKDFLGFTTINNAPIQTKNFFKKTEEFVKNYYDSYETKNEILNKLSDKLVDEDLKYINPKELSEDLFSKSELREQYHNEVAEILPFNISKDNLLIRSNLNVKKISFPNNIKLSGPADFMDVYVEVINSKEELEKLSTDQSTYTIIKVFGKPYSKE